MSDAHTNESFNKDIIAYKNNSIVVNVNSKKIWISYKLSTITNVKNSPVYFIKTKNERLNYYVSPLLFLIHNFVVYMFLLNICFKSRPRVVLAEGYLYALYAGVFRKCGLCNKSIYLSGDWLYGHKDKSRRLAYIANHYFFPYMDYLACKLNDVVVNYVDKIKDSRYKYWNKKIANKERVESLPYRIFPSNINLEKNNKKICFIGNMRSDCGLDMAIKSLNKLRKYSDFSLIIVGAFSHNYKYFYNLAEQHQVEKYVEFLGFLDRDKFAEVLTNCFCGLNMIIYPDSYTSYTIPGKSMDYLQYLLPSISTKYIGEIATVIQKHSLGIIIEPSENEFISAVLEIYREQKKFRENIINFINTSQKLNVRELIDD